MVLGVMVLGFSIIEAQIKAVIGFCEDVPVMIE
jgi:hypothetical protein